MCLRITTNNTHKSDCREIETKIDESTWKLHQFVSIELLLSVCRCPLNGADEFLKSFSARTSYKVCTTLTRAWLIINTNNFIEQVANANKKKTHYIKSRRHHVNKSDDVARPTNIDCTHVVRPAMSRLLFKATSSGNRRVAKRMQW